MNTAGRRDVVLLHGWLMGPNLWDTQLSALGNVANLHALAAPAHGTPGPPEAFTMAAWADLVVAELDQRSIDRAIIVGHSMSGWLSQQIWRDHPGRVLGLGLVGIAARSATPDEAEQFKELGRRCATEWRPIAPGLAELLVGEKYLAANPGWVEHWIDHVERRFDLPGMAPLTAAVAERPDYTPTTSQIDVPTMVIHGADDRAIPVEMGRDLAGIVPAATLVVVPDCGHAPPIDQPDAVTDAIRTLIEQVVANVG
ncbi:MAG: alpha/beta fold hydrolase [Acidimicrobiales bacterium]